MLTDIDNHLFTVTFSRHLSFSYFDELIPSRTACTTEAMFAGVAPIDTCKDLLLMCCYLENIAVSLRYHLSFTRPEKRGKIACIHYKQLSKYSIDERVRL